MHESLKSFTKAMTRLGHMINSSPFPAKIVHMYRTGTIRLALERVRLKFYIGICYKYYVCLPVKNKYNKLVLNCIKCVTYVCLSITVLPFVSILCYWYDLQFFRFVFIYILGMIHALLSYHLV